MLCGFCCNSADDLRTLVCGAIGCINCLRTRSVNNFVRCNCPANSHFQPYISQLRKVNTLNDLNNTRIENPDGNLVPQEVNGNGANERAHDPRVHPLENIPLEIPQVEPRNLCRNFWRHFAFRWPNRYIWMPITVFFTIFFPFLVAGMHFLNTTASDCNGIRPWLTIWIIFCFFELTISVLNTGFAREKWNTLRVIEKVLRITWFVFTGFLMIWVLVGCGWVFEDQECKTSSYKIWAISMAILIFWLILFGSVALYFIGLGLKYLHFFKNYKFKFMPEWVVGFTLCHFLVIESMVKNMQIFPGIKYLYEDPDCSGIESSWLIVWIALSLASLLTWNVAICSREKSPATICIWGLSIIISLFLFAWVFVGASLIFMDESCKNDSYNLWAICSAISGFWISVFGLIIVVIISFLLHKFGVNDFKPGFSVGFTVFHMIFFESMNFAGIKFLYDGLSCLGFERYFICREWLAFWIAISLAMLLTVNIAINSEERTCPYFFFLALTILLNVFLVAWVFVGAALIFMDSECQNDAYSLWAICSAICGFWIAMFGISIAFAVIMIFVKH